MAPHPPLSSRYQAVPTPLPERPHPPPSPTRPRTKRRRNNRHSLAILSTLIGSIASGGVLSTWLFVGEENDDVAMAGHRAGSRRVEGEREGIRPAGVDAVVKFLMGLAEKRPAELWDIFGAGGEG